MVRDQDIPISTVVILSSFNHVGRVGKAAYAGDIVKAFGRIQGVCKKCVQLVQSYPLIWREFMDGRGGQMPP